MASYINIAKPNTCHSPELLTDLRLLDVPKSITKIGTLDKLLKLNVYRYNIKDSHQELTGFVAQEVQREFPDVIDGKKYEATQDKKPRYKYFNNHAMLGVLTLALQDLKGIFDRSSLLHRKFTMDEIKKVQDVVDVNLSNAKSQFENVNVKFNEVQTNINETAKTAKTDLQTVETNVNKKQSELEAKITVNDKVLRSIVAKMQELNQTNLQKLATDIKTNADTFVSFKADYMKAEDSQNSTIADLKKTIDANRQSSDTELSQVNQHLQNTDINLTKHKEATETQFKTTNETIQANHTQITTNYVTNANLNEIENTINQKIANANVKIDTNKTLTNSHIEDTKNNFLNTNKAITSLKKHLDENVENVRKTEKTIDTNARSFTDKINDVYSVMETRINETNGNLTKYTNTQISEANQKCENHTVAKIEEFRLNLNTKIIAMDKTIDYLSLKANDTSILDGKISEFLRDINNRFNKVYETMDKAGEKEEIISNVKLMIDASKFDPAPFELEFKKCRDDIQGLQFTLTDIYKTSSKNITTMQGIQNQFDELNAKMIDLTNMITGLIRKDDVKDNIVVADNSLEIIDEL